jgi:dienelactone hydrolase
MNGCRPAFLALIVAMVSLAGGRLSAAMVTNKPTPGDFQLDDYFRAETLKLEAACLADIKTLDDWNSRRDTYRRQLEEMLGLSPMPPRTDLKPVVTGRLEHEQFTVEKLHFQSMPQLYVTANLYLPKNLAKPAPAILYVSGHAVVKTNGVSLGNKAGYQHHGEWFARHGYVCLTIDTIQLGELEGVHHGTFREGMWWWNSRGYTPAGVEAWNGIRAIDYLQSRPEADGSRIGVTGRSGGGAYSWWIAALDERIKVACPVAGITDLHNHVIDGTVQGHCDCMFMVNTYRWDYAQVAALVAPRPLLICNTDKDSIFPLEVLERLHQKVRNIYRLNGAADKLGLLITEGPHKDTQDLQVPVFRWFNRYLKRDEPLIATPAEKLFPPIDLKVFKEKPADERTTKIHETFVPMASAPEVPKDESAWSRQRDEWMAALREKSFRGWPEAPGALANKPAFDAKHDGLRLRAVDFTSQEHVPLRLYVAEGGRARTTKRVIFEVLGEPGWAAWLAAMREGFGKELAAEIHVAGLLATNNVATPSGDFSAARLKVDLDRGDAVHIFLAPRGIGLSAWNPTARETPHIRRRFMLLGQALDAMRVWDIRRGLEAARALKDLERASFDLRASGSMGVNALYASLFEPKLAALRLNKLPASHRNGPDYLNVLRFLDLPQAVAMAAGRMNVELSNSDPAASQFAAEVASKLKWPAGRLVLHGAQ